MPTDMRSSAGGLKKEDRAPDPSPPLRMAMWFDEGQGMSPERAVSCTFGESAMKVGGNINRNSCTGAFSVAL